MKTYRVPVEFMAANDDAARRLIEHLASADEVRLSEFPIEYVVDELSVGETCFRRVTSTEETKT